MSAPIFGRDLSDEAERMARGENARIDWARRSGSVKFEGDVPVCFYPGPFLLGPMLPVPPSMYPESYRAARVYIERELERAS